MAKTTYTGEICVKLVREKPDGTKTDKNAPDFWEKKMNSGSFYKKKERDNTYKKNQVYGKDK